MCRSPNGESKRVTFFPVDATQIENRAQLVGLRLPSRSHVLGRGKPRDLPIIFAMTKICQSSRTSTSGRDKGETPA